MNFFVIKEVWFRYIFSNQKRGRFKTRTTCTESADTPGFLFITFPEDSTREYNY
ncbi:hypothetical protein LEP1GSC137_4010 [Leptospira borgpetersenii str. Noumea 25]|uniref:Uncharacterized protein n=4 Tax=Leptospira borgpetersenii TaxID=174 RepID=M3GLB5_LEPBO|nr:hypothetical protein LBBP_02799 [Leptospira borgpetersenii serovar Ballum]EKP15143.1 hypothetical protein LEP1GSC128_2338 [Leptospira borgpetersenii str. 200801926]EKQ99324.1 hypothetical protein LEP1GSC121_2625 [Leptospira borgpetersenii serovar Castellonis str. 200801910]EMG01787.1 hypothetical protein LEP1GSC123_0229 [Leptospira borgpetersenii str. 200701203]EMK09458.1 hypothetical protein LEP1GSC066_2012 [Leptospira sp. serovar Kenya str. Sh9]EMN14647.1 hypothetical protein LEP1GSC055_3